MNRIFSLIFGVIINIFIPRKRRMFDIFDEDIYSRYDKYKIDGYDLNTSSVEARVRNDVADNVRLHFRRKSAFKQAKSFLRKKENSYQLKNRYVSVIYNVEQKIIKCFDKSIKKRIATIEWFKQNTVELQYKDNLFEETFDSVCALFNEKSTYDGVVDTFRYHFKVEETQAEVDKISDNSNLPTNFSDILDVNNATEKQLTDLPCISVIQAKNIIKKRDAQNGFKSIEEFFEVMKMNDKLQAKLRPYLCVNDYVAPNKTDVPLIKDDILDLDYSSNNQSNEDRIIDL